MTRSDVSGRKSFIADSALTVANQVTSLTLSIVGGIILARELGPASNGIFAMLILVPQTAVNLLTRGADQTILYFVASKRWEEHEIYPILMGMFVYLFGLGAIILGLVYYYRSSLLGNVPTDLLLICTIVYPLDLLRGLLNGILVGRREFRLETICGIFSGLARLLLVFLMVSVLHLGVSGAVYAFVLGAFLSAASYHFSCRRVITSTGQRIELSPQKLLPAIGYGIKASVSNIIAVLNYRMDQFLLNFIAGPSAVGIYVLAVSIAEKVWLVTHNATKAFFPRMAASEKSQSDLADTACRLAGILLPILVLVSLTVAAISTVIPAVYGVKFAGSVAVIRWLLPGITLVAFAKVFSHFLAARGRPGLNAVAGVFGILVNLIANLILVPRYGAVGAAAATTLSYGAMAFGFYVFFIKVTAVKWRSPFMFRRHDADFLFEQGRGAIAHTWGRVATFTR